MDKRLMRIDMWALDDLFGVERHPTQFVYEEVDWSTITTDKYWTKERREEQSKRQQDNAPGSKPVTYKGKKYPSMTAAAKANGVCRQTVSNHLSGKSIEGRKAGPRGPNKKK